MKQLALWVMLLGIGGFAGYMTRGFQEIFGDLNTAGVIEWQDSRMDFVQDVAASACATTSDLREAASARGWEVGPLFDPGMDPFDRAAEVLWVDVRPGLPFSKWDRDPFGFDADGCLLN
ncbi:hypothetical protein BDE40_0121 [Litoreibacter halocynthiae]|uniref:Uncharacterized protein n=1 Tax=Litoreibacter halocynthiae TaxID=1242689 RepID=A0A4R7LN40_9RHOB|nr:hypothetical protein [Litoreibacter halocynthiae]TDT76849.1 hypothetical protein BDE40_0121 [Litoreibacter halocynthiae]